MDLINAAGFVLAGSPDASSISISAPPPAMTLDLHALAEAAATVSGAKEAKMKKKQTIQYNRESQMPSERIVVQSG